MGRPRIRHDRSQLDWVSVRQLLPCIPAGWVPQNPRSVLHTHAGTRTTMGRRNFGAKISGGDAGSGGRKEIMSERIEIVSTYEMLMCTATD
jgi:hypothetical protein